MFRVARTGTTSRLLSSRGAVRRQLSTTKSSNPLEGDNLGWLSTHGYHTLTLALAGLAPAYFIMPDGMTDGFFGKSFGLLLSANITAHSWIGLNYV